MKAISRKFAVFLIIILGLLIYSNSLNTGFHYDDRYNIERNKQIRDISGVKALWRYKKPRLITHLTFAVNYLFGRLQAFHYHLTNLLIHICSSITVYFLAIFTFETPGMKKTLLRKHARIIALFSGLIFLSHPLQVQAVTYISQRFASLCGLFYIVSVLFYLKSRLTQKFFYYFLALLTIIAAMFTKENAVTLPLTVLVYELVFFGARKKDAKKIFLRIMPILLLTIIASGISSNIVPRFIESHKNRESLQELNFLPRVPKERCTISRKNYFLTELNAMRTYMRLLFFPVNQNLDYDYPVSRSIREPRTIFSLFLLSAVIIFAMGIFKKERLISFGIFWFLIAISVESGFVPLPDVIQEHRLYLPMAGFALFVTSAMALVISNKTRLFILLIALVSGFSLLTYNRNRVWKNGFTLWQDTVRKSPNKFRPHHYLGFIYYNMAAYDEAMREYQRAAAIDPGSSDIYHSLGVIYANKRNYDKAIECYQKSILFGPPRLTDIYYALGACYVYKNDLENARKQLAVLRRLNQNRLAGRLELLIKSRSK